MESTRELGAQQICLFAISHFKFYVTCYYSFLVLQKKKKKKVDIHSIPKEKRDISNLIVVVGPNHGEEDKYRSCLFVLQ